jgi:hypothetical protein
MVVLLTRNDTRSAHLVGGFYAPHSYVSCVGKRHKGPCGFYGCEPRDTSLGFSSPWSSCVRAKVEHMGGLGNCYVTTRSKVQFVRSLQFSYGRE